MKKNTADNGGCEFCNEVASRTCLMCGANGCSDHIIDNLCEVCDNEVEASYLAYEEESEDGEWQ